MSDAPAATPIEEAALAMRRLGHALISNDPDPELLRRVAAGANETAELVEQSPKRVRDMVAMKREMFEEPARAAPGEPISHFDECFVSGRHNPMGIGIQVFRDGEDSVAWVELGAAFEGAPGRSHGGIVAAIFDDVLGYLLSIHKQPAFTGELTVRYRAPTPMGERLTFRGRLVDRQGRKLMAEGKATAADGTVVATATATFIAVDVSAFKP
jgi:acyl-coenzyme A thioesterase PaaI-like protein